MRALFGLTAVSLAAMIIVPAPAEAEDRQSFGFVSGGSGFHGTFGPSDRRDRRRHRRGDSFVYIDRDYQGDSLWRSESFNDWWHNQPERSYPRWMMSNQNCDRMFWSGGAWRC